MNFFYEHNAFRVSEIAPTGRLAEDVAGDKANTGRRHTTLKLCCGDVLHGKGCGHTELVITREVRYQQDSTQVTNSCRFEPKLSLLRSIVDKQGSPFVKCVRYILYVLLAGLVFCIGHGIHQYDTR